MIGWLTLILIIAISLVVGYFIGWAKGYNQFLKDIEDGDELREFFESKK